MISIRAKCNIFKGYTRTNIVGQIFYCGKAPVKLQEAAGGSWIYSKFHIKCEVFTVSFWRLPYQKLAQKHLWDFFNFKTTYSSFFFALKTIKENCLNSNRGIVLGSRYNLFTRDVILRNFKDICVQISLKISRLKKLKVCLK